MSENVGRNPLPPPFVLLRVSQPPPHRPDPIDLLGADVSLDPRFRGIRRFLGAWEAFEALQYLVGGFILLAVGFAVWRSGVLSAQGPASARAAQDAHDGILVITVGIGALTLLAGSVGLYWGIRRMREETDGKWG